MLFSCLFTSHPHLIGTKHTARENCVISLNIIGIIFLLLAAVIYLVLIVADIAKTKILKIVTFCLVLVGCKFSYTHVRYFLYSSQTQFLTQSNKSVRLCNNTDRSNNSGRFSNIDNLQ